jgi:hypothetical protein
MYLGGGGDMGLHRCCGYKKGYLVKIKDFFFQLERCIGRGGQQNDFGSYFPISREIRGIL